MGLWEDDETNNEHELVPCGTYVMVLDDVKLDETNDPSVLTLRFSITGGDFQNKKIWMRFRMNEKSTKWIQWQLGILGIATHIKDMPSWTEAGRKACDLAAEMVDRLHVDMEVHHNEYNNKTYANGKILSVYEGEIRTDGVKNMAPTAPAPLKMDTSDDLPF